MQVYFSRTLIPELRRTKYHPFGDIFNHYRAGYIYFLYNTPEALYNLLSNNLVRLFDEEEGKILYDKFTSYEGRLKRRKQILSEVRKIKSKIEYNKFYPELLVLSKLEIRELKEEIKKLEREKVEIAYENRDWYTYRNEISNTVRMMELSL